MAALRSSTMPPLGSHVASPRETDATLPPFIVTATDSQISHKKLMIHLLHSIALVDTALIGGTGQADIDGKLYDLLPEIKHAGVKTMEGPLSGTLGLRRCLRAPTSDRRRTDFTALRSGAIGTQRHFPALPNLYAIAGTADIRRSRQLPWSDVIDARHALNRSNTWPQLWSFIVDRGHKGTG
jgi:hypothetical protein